jgi:hypothetical protein
MAAASSGEKDDTLEQQTMPRAPSKEFASSRKGMPRVSSLQVMQAALDRVFENTSLTSLRFSFTIADPSMEGCPLVGCSSGFKDLCGYSEDEIIGHNCRFMVDPVPADRVRLSSRKFARLFSEAVRDGRPFELAPEEREPWMLESRPQNQNSLMLVQCNMRKDGTLFNNMFYLKAIYLNEKPHIIGLQTELKTMDISSYASVHQACQYLDDNLGEVERILAGHFWVGGSMSRQDVTDYGDGFRPDEKDEAPLSAPKAGCMCVTS